jgi:hypothetical protein
LRKVNCSLAIGDHPKSQLTQARDLELPPIVLGVPSVVVGLKVEPVARGVAKRQAQLLRYCWLFHVAHLACSHIGRVGSVS